MLIEKDGIREDAKFKLKSRLAQIGSCDIKSLKIRNIESYLTLPYFNAVKEKIMNIVLCPATIMSCTKHREARP